jgi:glycosyltransferase involved in cell wall biosynthesis
VTQALRELAAGAGLGRIHVLAWRDLDDDEAGGSEVHADAVASLWAGAGIDVVMRTSAAPGLPAEATRNGYRVVRRQGRHLVFPAAVVDELRGRLGPRDGVVEIWNGMPFLSPTWAGARRSVWIHHVHAEMWRMALPRPLADAGMFLERRLAPPLYRGTNVVTLSASSRDELVHELHLRPERVAVVPPGIDPRFGPGGARSAHPLVVAVGRLAPVKRFDLLVEALVRLRRQHPTLEAVLVGQGEERPALERQIAAAGATGWLRLAGHVDDDGLLDLYRRAWVLTSASLREGWGMTITEAAACGTPAVVTRIGGHVDAVADGESGLLVEVGELADALGRVVADEHLRARLGAGALARAATFSWGATALGTLQALAAAPGAHPGAGT